MPTLQIKSGDTLSKIALANNTSVADLLAANKTNPAVKSANLIIAGGSINLPEKAVVPAAAAPTGGGVAPSVGTGFAPSAPSGTDVSGDLGNLRIALRSALNEAAQKRVENNFKSLGGLASGATPGTIGSVVDMIRGGIKSPVETTFSDIISGYKDATDAKQKEVDRINQLRSEYGSLVPSSVTDLKTALDLIAPTVDKERRLKLAKMASDQASDNDVETWAQGLADGTYKPGNVPAAIRTAAVVRADVLRKKLEADAKIEYQDRIAFRLEKKTSDFEQERALVIQDDNLNVAEQRDVINYIDGLEAAQKASKAKGGKGFFNFLNPSGAAPAPTNMSVPPKPPSPFGPTAPAGQSSIGSLKPFDDAFVQPFRDLFKQK